MIFRSLKTTELDAWYAHCHEVFDGDADNYFQSHVDMDPFADPSLIFVAMDGDTIAATVRVFRRRIWLQGRAVEMGGVGEVSTKAAYRRRGLGTELLAMAVAAMVERGMPISILFGDLPMYARAGWRVCRTRYKRMAVHELAKTPEYVQVRAFTPDDLPTVMGLYDLYAGRMDGAVVRAKTYWRRWVLPQWRMPLVAVQDGRVVAYACAAPNTEENDTVWASEACAAPGFEQALDGLLRALAESNHMPTVSIGVPPNDMMARLNTPILGLETSDALVAAMTNAGMCAVDMF